MNWKQSVPIPAKIKDMLVFDCKPQYFDKCRVIFSGLDSSIAGLFILF